MNHRLSLPLSFSVYAIGRRGEAASDCDLNFEGEEGGDDDDDRGSCTCPEDGEKDQRVKMSIFLMFGSLVCSFKLLSWIGFGRRIGKCRRLEQSFHFGESVM